MKEISETIFPYAKNILSFLLGAGSVLLCLYIRKHKLFDNIKIKSKKSDKELLLTDCLEKSWEILIKDSISAPDASIDLVTDVLSWINGKLKMLLNQGVKEVDVLDGKMLVDLIKKKQADEQKGETFSLEQLTTLEKSVILVAMDGDRVVDQQMIRSLSGLSAESRSQFQGKPVMKIKIA